MKIHLAPMEGVVDHTMRAMLTQVGAIDRCVTEFIRITDQRLPSRVFYRYCPELKQGGKTPSGVPVFVQLLGGKPEPMAENAKRAAELGALGVDINFGCPAKQVNKNDGGSVILKEPLRVFEIVSAVRKSVDKQTPVTAKIRLGFNDRSLLAEITQAVIDAGANELTIHARTKEDGYKPPAYWDAIAAVKDKSPIPVIANGEIWSVQDYYDCVEQSGCDDVMLGRGLLACPDLALQIRQHKNKEKSQPIPWADIVELLEQFSMVTEEEYEPKYVGNRVKQWLGYLRTHYQMAEQLFQEIKRLKKSSEIFQAIQKHKLGLPDKR